MQINTRYLNRIKTLSTIYLAIAPLIMIISLVFVTVSISLLIEESDLDYYYVIFLFSIPLLLSLFLIYKGISHHRDSKRSFAIAYAITNRVPLHLEQIASEENLSVQETAKHLERMIKKGYVSGIFINYQSGFVSPLGREAPQNDFVRTVCKTCGAVNMLRHGTTGRCDYCGSFISED